ncbi:MAG: DUF2207 domain-containing protein [Myxococcales bacterium]|nr:DUF2207 domain-containing protein [Myxococcales bacterium]MCB9532431.1 DUF2207 domain-containing protein [Myxococcales bacterium]
MPPRRPLRPLLALTRPLTLAGVAFVGVVSPADAAAAVIDRIDVTLALAADGVVDVAERVQVDLENAWVPGWDWDLSPSARAHQLVALVAEDDAGRALALTRATVGERTHIGVADPAGVVTGTLALTARYSVIDATAAASDGSRVLEWSLLGGAHAVPVRALGATVSVPSAPSGSLGYRCTRTDAPGECTVAVDRGQLSVTANDLAPFADVVVEVTIPAAVIGAPSPLRRALLRSEGHVHLGWVPGALVATLLLASRRRPRPTPADAVPLPPSLRPATASALARRALDADALAATLLDLAQRGHVELRPTLATTPLRGSRRDFTLTRTRAPGDALAPFEGSVLDTLFEMSDAVSISSLRGRLHADLATLSDAMGVHAARGDRAFYAAPGRIRSVAMTAAALGALGALGALRFDQPLAARALIGVSAAFALIGPLAWPANAAGRAIARGLGAWAAATRQAASDHATPPLPLPHALAVGELDAALDHAATATHPPSWWRGAPDEFAADLGRFVDSVRAAAAPPVGAIPHHSRILR